MANILLAWQNRADEGTLSGGSWLAALPLTNVQNRQVQKVARSAALTTAATQFDADTGGVKSIGVVALVVHNFSVTSKYRITASDALASWTSASVFPNDLDNAAWTKTNATITANAAIAPDGTTTADAVIETAVSGQHYVSQTPVTVAAGTNGIEAWIKASTRAKGYIVLDKSGYQALTWFDLNTGTVYSTTGTASILNNGDGWYKITVYNSAFTAGTTAMYIVAADAIGATTYTGNGGTAFYVWGARHVSGYPPIYESGWQSVWPSGVIPQNLLEWEDDNFWLGTLSQQARAGYQSPLIHILPVAQALRYWRVEVQDTTNSDGYIQIGRLFMSPAWTPSINYEFGSGLGYRDPTPIETSLSGAEYFAQRSKAREFSFTLGGLTKSEAYDYVLQLQRLAGISGEILQVPDSSDTGRIPARAFVGRLSQISPIQNPQPDRFSAAFTIKELI